MKYDMSCGMTHHVSRRHGSCFVYEPWVESRFGFQNTADQMIDTSLPSKWCAPFNEKIKQYKDESRTKEQYMRLNEHLNQQ